MPRLDKFLEFGAFLFSLDLTKSTNYIRESIFKFFPPKFLKNDSSLAYLMAAFADEYLLNAAWQGANYWFTNLLEENLFQTHIAGEEFFRNAQTLSAKRYDDELGYAYLAALKLGFRGKYKGYPTEIKKYTQQLQEVFLDISPLSSISSNSTNRHFQHISTGHPMVYLPNPNKWFSLTLVVVFIILLIQFMIHSYFSTSIYKHIAGVLELIPVNSKF